MVRRPAQVLAWAAVALAAATVAATGVVYLRHWSSWHEFLSLLAVGVVSAGMLAAGARARRAVVRGMTGGLLAALWLFLFLVGTFVYVPSALLLAGTAAVHAPAWAPWKVAAAAAPPVVLAAVMVAWLDSLL